MRQLTALHRAISTACGNLAQVGVAVSGGGDSLALLHLMNDLGCNLRAVTVNHGLRPEAAAEADQVAALCARIGVAHDRLDWTEWNGAGNLQDQARRARYRLMAEWGQALNLDAIALGHTADDQAETFLMRLARQAGVDGLSRMDTDFQRDGMQFLRPLLGCRRAELRDFLTARGLTWVEDPSNDDARFDRVKARQTLAALAPLGIDATTLAQVSGHMATARQALQIQTATAAQTIAREEYGALIFRRAALLDLPPEIFRRLLSGAVRFVDGAGYAPRAEPILALREAILSGKGATLNGCRLLVKRDDVWLCAELNALRDMACASDQVWSARWRFHGPHAPDFTLSVLGDAGLSQCPDWRDGGAPRDAVAATPAVWRRDRVISAPMAGFSNGWRVELTQGIGDYVNNLLSH